MLRHVVMFRWKPTADSAAKDTVNAGLAALPDQIASIRAYRFGPDAGLDDGNWDFVIVADFDDVAGYQLYAEDPVHRRLISESIAPHVEARAAVQHHLEVGA